MMHKVYCSQQSYESLATYYTWFVTFNHQFVCDAVHIKHSKVAKRRKPNRPKAKDGVVYIFLTNIGCLL